MMMIDQLHLRPPWLQPRRRWNKGEENDDGEAAPVLESGRINNCTSEDTPSLHIHVQQIISVICS